MARHTTIHEEREEFLTDLVKEFDKKKEQSNIRIARLQLNIGRNRRNLLAMAVIFGITVGILLTAIFKEAIY